MNDNQVELSVISWINSLWVNEYAVYWFLKNLIVFIMLAPVIWVLLKNHWKKVPTGLLALVVLVVSIKTNIINFKYSQGLGYYLIGSYIGINLKDFLKYKNKIISIISIIYIAFEMLTLFRFWGFIFICLFIFAVWYALDLINWGDKKLPWWTQITFFTYVAHSPLLEALEKVILLIGGKKEIFALLDFIIAPIITELCLILLAYILRRFTPEVWGVITGGRGK